ncbi:MAG: methionyl-tRNA formyltransferase [Chlamydiales bacterium]|nr:methionyl-tRNA formyltransferase [Chlamydiales bacterium]
MKIVFFGTPLFAAKILEYLVDKSINIVAVVTRPDKPKGRGLLLVPPPVKEVATKLLPSIPIYQPIKASDPDFAQQLKIHQADFFIVAAFGQILRQNILDIPLKGCVNVHASLLPKYRGAAPIQKAIIEGEEESGVTIMKMSLGMDEGDILHQVRVSIPFDMDAGALQDVLCEVGCHALLDTLQAFKEGHVSALPQEHSAATYAPKIELVDCEIDFSKEAIDLHNLIRGCTPVPGSWVKIFVKGQAKKLKVIRAKPLVCSFKEIPGSILQFGKKGWIVACGKSALQLIDIQLEGKKAMSAEDFANGYSIQDISFF